MAQYAHPHIQTAMYCRRRLSLASDFNTVVHEVVCQSLGLTQVSTILPTLLLVGRCEGMVQSLMPLLLFIPLEHGKVCDPQQGMLLRVCQVELLGNVLPYSVQPAVHCSFIASSKQ